MAYKRSFSSAYAGTAASLSSSYYLRNFYISNRDAYTAVKREDSDTDTLSMSDSMALRRAVRQLGSFSYDETQNESIRNSVLAYIDTYNNALSSASSLSDDSMNRLGKQLKSLTNAYSDELDKIGITVNEDGTLKSRDNLFKSSDLSGFETLFSKDSDYMQRTSAYAKRIQTRSEALIQTRRQRTQSAAGNVPATGSSNAPAESGTPDSAPDTTAAAQIVAQSMDLDTLCHTGIGANVNLSL